MRDLSGWSLSLGHWFGVRVRLHVFFVLLAVVAAMQPQFSEQSWFLLASLVILLFSVLAHEFGHCFAAFRVGGTADQVVIWPLGGLAEINRSRDPQAEFFTALGGPLANLAICLVVAPALLLCHVSLPLNPLVAPWSSSLDWVTLLSITFWLNAMLVMVNLLPAFPMDGGRALRAVIWSRSDHPTAVTVVSHVARLTAVVLFVAAFFVYSATSPMAWVSFVLLGLVLLFSAKQEAERLREQDPLETPFGYDFSEGYTSLDRSFETATRPRQGPLKRWLERRRQMRLEREQARELEEERRLDEILERLHENGMEGLSEEDRDLLMRASARYRSRQRGF